MGNLKFQKLTPTQDVDLSGYEEALEYVFSEDDIRNVALAGAYSSGKSSVIESYKKKHADRSFIHLSLAHFHPQNIDEDDASEDQEAIIEGKILNQLIQQIPASRIPQTNFRTKHDLNKRSVAIGSVLVCLFLASIMHFARFASWKNWVVGLDDGLFKTVMMFSAYQWTRAASILVSLSLLGYALYKFICYQHNKNILRIISFQGNEIEIFADSDESYFDKYLNEVLYLFENASVDGIVFEDIDRFNNTSIFERLREINTLTNIRLKEKSNGDSWKPLRFIYLMRDDIFENKDRTKFFDFILPIVPVLDSSNSYNKIKEYLDGVGIYNRFDDHFLRGISLYIDDLRIVKNIFNEFLIYNHKLNSIELDTNKLFAIITYKNIFPKDFTDLQYNQGFVHTLFKSKVKLIADRIEDVSEEITEIEERISLCENELLENQAELDAVKANKENSAKGQGTWSQQYRDYQEWYQNVYPKRMQALEDRATGNISKLRKQAEQKKEEKAKIENLQLADLIDRKNIDEVFRVDYINEVEQVENFYEIKSNPYFSLLKYLISRGYIDESYSDYMTFFYPNSLSLRDKVFLRAVADRSGKQSSYQLDSPALVTENLNEYDFSQPETLNYALSEYILSSDKDDYVKSMILQMATEKRFDYVEGYMRSDKAIVPMIVAIDSYWPEMFQEALNNRALPDDLIRRFSYLTLTSIEDEALNAINIDGCLRKYVSEDPSYLVIDDIDTEKLSQSLSYLDVSFTEINSEGINESLFDYVHQHDLYDINASNIRLMLVHKCFVENTETIQPALLTFLRDHQSEYSSCKYMWAQVDKTLPIYLDMYDGSIQDSSDTIVDLMNDENVDQIFKEAFVERLETNVDQIATVASDKEQKMLIVHKKVAYSVENVLFYFKRYGLTEELIKFINSDELVLDYINSSDEECVDQFLDNCICEKTIDNEKYRQIMGNLCATMKDFSVEELSDEKVEILIGLGLIEMNSSNLKFMRTTYPDSTNSFIRQDVEEYISIAEGSDFSLKEATEVLEWQEVSDQQKIKLLKQTTDGIKIQNMKLSDDLINYIFTNNLSEEDWPWMLKSYEEFSGEVKDTILTIASEELTFIASNYSDKIGKAMLIQLFESEVANFAAKMQLLEKTAKSLDKEQLCLILNQLGADKIADNINGGKKKVKITNDNSEILDALYNADVILKPAQAADGQHYKNIRYKSKILSDLLPESLL